MDGSSGADLLKWRIVEEECHSSKNWSGLADALLGQAQAVAGPAEKAGYNCRAGAAAMKAGDDDKALDCFLKVEGDALWLRLARQYRMEIHWRRGDWEAAASLLDEELGAGSGWDATSLKLEKARILAFRLGRIGDAQAVLDGLLAENARLTQAVWIKLTLALRAGDWEGVKQNYERLFELCGADPAFSGSCAFRLGQICEFRFQDGEGARGWYEKAGEKEGALLSSLSLYEIAEGKKEWDKAANHLASAVEEILAAGETPPAQLRLSLARLRADGLEDPEGADKEIQAILETWPDFFPALYQAALRAMETGPPELRADLDARMAGLIEDPAERSFYLADRARTLLDDLSDPEAAVEAASSWMETAPEDLFAGAWVIESLVRAGAHQEAIEAIDRELGRVADPRERQGLLLRKAELATHKMGNQDMALAAYMKALETPPSQFPILQAMSRMYHMNRDFANMAKVMTASAKMVTDPAVKKFYQTWLALINLEKLGREDQAFAIFGEIMKVDPADQGALAAIARLSRKNSSWQNLAGAVARMSENAKDEKMAAELKSRLGWLYEVRLDKADQAFAIYKSLAAGKHAFGMDSLRRVHYQKGELAPYAGMAQELAESGSEGVLRGARLLRMASAREVLGELTDSWAACEKARVSFMREPHLYLPMIDLAQLAGYWSKYMSLLEDFSSRLADEHKKAVAWEAAWARGEIAGPDGKIDPSGMARAMKALEEVPGAEADALRGAWLASVWSDDKQERPQLLARALKILPEDYGTSVRLRLAGVLRDELGANEESIAALRQVLAKEPKSAPIMRELSLMYEKAGQWGELIRMMLTELPLRKEKEVQIETYLRLARHYEEHFQALDESIKCQQAVLRLVPDRAESHSELVRLLEAKGRWEDMVAALVAFKDVTGETSGKIDLLFRAARTLDEKLQDPNRAIAMLREALDLDPARLETLSELERLYEREQRWEELIEILVSQAEKLEADSDKAVLHERVAKIVEEHLGDPGRAIEHLIVARDLDPERRSVLLTLERLFEAASRWEELIDTLERLAARADDQGKIDYFGRIGSLWDEKLERLEDAISSWERVRSIDSQNVPGLEALVSLYERTGKDPEFVERSRELAELVARDKPRAVEILCKAGQTLETKLTDDDGALEVYGRAMAIDDHATRPVFLAKSIYEKREQWPDVVKMLLREEKIVGEASRKLEIFTEAGQILEHKLGDEKQAAGAYERALAIDGKYLPSVKPLSEIYYKSERWADARPLYEIWIESVDSETDEKGAEVFHKAGWCAERGDDVDAAMSRYHSSVGLAADYRPPLERLSDIYTQKKKWAEASSFTDRLLAVVTAAQDLEAAFPLYVRKGEIEEKQDKLDKATEAYEKALEIRPKDFPALTKLVDLYCRQELWKNALAAFDRMIQAAPSSEAQADGLVGKGEVLEDKLGEENSALAHFQAAVKVLPTHLHGWDRISRIFLRRQSWPEAENALLHMIDLETDSMRLVENHHSLGRVYFEGLNDLEKARTQFEAALAIDQVHVPSMQSLGDIYLKLEEWDKYISTSENFIRLVPPEEHPSLINLYYKLGEVYRDHTENKERAIINFQQVLKIQPENETARSELAAIYVSDPKFVDQAKAENLNLIRMQPWRKQTYRDLANIYKEKRQLDAQFCLYSILKLLDSLDYEEDLFYEANKAKAFRSSQKILPDIEREGQMVHPDERGPLRDMLLAMADQMTKIFPPPLEKFGAKKQYKLDGSSESPLKDLAADVAHNLGVEDLDMYLVPQAAPPQVVHGSPPALIVSTEWFKKFTPHEQRFVMGRALEHLVDRHSLAMHFPPDKVIAQLCLVALAFDPNLQLNIPGMPPQEVEKKRKLSKKLIPWNARKVKAQVEAISPRFSQEVAETDPARWRKAMDHTANRAGLLVCGDVTAAFDAIVKTDPKYANVKYNSLEEKMAVWEKHPDVIELLAFSVSDQYFRLRERSGFSLA